MLEVLIPARHCPRVRPEQFFSQESLSSQNSIFWLDRPTLVTGGTGLVGSWLVRRLCDVGAYVVCLVRDWVPQSELAQSPPAWLGASPSPPATDSEAQARLKKKKPSENTGLWCRAISMLVLELLCAILD